MDAEEIAFDGGKRWIRHLGDADEARALMLAIEADATVSHLDVKIQGLNGNDIAAAIAQGLGGNTTLTRFSAWHCNIGVQGGIAIARSLETNTTLTHLGLVGNAIEDAGAEALGVTLGKENSALTGLNLQMCSIGDLGLTAILNGLRTRTNFDGLDMSKNYIGRAGMEALGHALASNWSLKGLTLCGCQVPGVVPAGMTAIANGLKTNTKLTMLCLDRVGEIGYSGALALADALTSNTTLEMLHVNMCGINTDGARALGWAWGRYNPRGLTISLGSPPTADDDDDEEVDDVVIYFQLMDRTSYVEMHAARRHEVEMNRREQLLAFGMGMHSRLGGAGFGGLDGDIFRLICEAYDDE
jgi:hypothetical protein